MTDEPGSREEFDARLRALNERRRSESDALSRSGPAKSDWGNAVKLSSEFIAAIIVGGLLGVACDYVFASSPWGLIVFFLLGFAAAVLNVLRTVGRAPESKLNARDVREAGRDER